MIGLNLKNKIHYYYFGGLKMFKDLKQGETHSWNDGCGEPEHNLICKECNSPAEI